MEYLYESIAVVIAVIAFAIAYWKSPVFRIIVNSYVKSQWRKYRNEIYTYIDAHVSDIMDELEVKVTASTHRYIKREVLRQAVDAKVKQGADFTDEWVKMKYKEIVEDLMNNL